jgi:hypothetical protein
MDWILKYYLDELRLQGLREEHRQRVFGKTVLRRIFGPRREEVTEGWRKLHNEELHNVYSSLSTIKVIKSKRMRWAGHEGHRRNMRNAYKILVGKSEGKRQLGRLRRIWERIIWKSMLEKRGGVCGLDSCDAEQGRVQSLVHTVMNLRIP